MTKTTSPQRLDIEDADRPRGSLTFRRILR
jgi:hypothetical protein